MGKRRHKARVTRQDIQELYVNERLPLREVAAKLNTTQTTIMNKVREYGFELRDKSSARLLAIDTGRIVYPRKHHFDKTFFDEIGHEQAYAMGIIWAGGYIAENGLNIMCGDSSVDVCSKLKELLGMDPLPYYIDSTKQTPMWNSVVTSADLRRRLMELGLQYGSHAYIALPKLPDELHADFVRGWWERRGFSAVSNRILTKLNPMAFPDTEMFYWNTGIFYSSFEHTDDIERAYHVLYDGLHPRLFVPRRRDMFIESETARAKDKDLRELYNALVDLPITPDRSTSDIHTWEGTVLTGKI